MGDAMLCLWQWFFASLIQIPLIQSCWFEAVLVLLLTFCIQSFVWEVRSYTCLCRDCVIIRNGADNSHSSKLAKLQHFEHFDCVDIDAISIQKIMVFWRSHEDTKKLFLRCFDPSGLVMHPSCLLHCLRRLENVQS